MSPGMTANGSTTISEEVGRQLLDFSQKLDIHLLDQVVSCMYIGDGSQVLLSALILPLHSQHIVSINYVAKIGSADTKCSQRPCRCLDSCRLNSRIFSEPPNKILCSTNSRTGNCII